MYISNYQNRKYLCYSQSCLKCTSNEENSNQNPFTLFVISIHWFYKYNFIQNIRDQSGTTY